MVMDVKPVSALKANMPAVLRDLRKRGSALLVVSKGQPQAVLQDVASYQGTQDAIALLKMMTQSEASVTAGRGSTTKAVMARLRARIKARR
jgi:PHD/YefM family antitoxin component YafN of YafNO toxin-antitoxin module